MWCTLSECSLDAYYAMNTEPCTYCGEPCRIPPVDVPFALDSVFCSPECREKHRTYKRPSDQERSRILDALYSSIHDCYPSHTELMRGLKSGAEEGFKSLEDLVGDEDTKRLIQAARKAITGRVSPRSFWNLAHVYSGLV